MNGQKSISALIHIYQGKHGPALDEYLATFKKQGSLNGAVEAVHLCSKNGRTMIHPHQQRLGRELFQGKIIPQLLRHTDRIAVCQSFDELYRCIKDRRKGIHRFGALAIYDTALRLGAHLNLWPNVVYLHAGTKKGCKSLGFTTSGETIEMKDLPEPLRAMEPYHAENFLCIFKDRLGAHNKGATGFLPLPSDCNGM
jgi:hypothetical protein